jgi:hypothetical protein
MPAIKYWKGATFAHIRSTRRAVPGTTGNEKVLTAAAPVSQPRTLVAYKLMRIKPDIGPTTPPREITKSRTAHEYTAGAAMMYRQCSPAVVNKALAVLSTAIGNYNGAAADPWSLAGRLCPARPLHQQQ